MDDTTQTDLGHRVPVGLRGLREQVGGLLEASLLGLGEDDARTALVEVTALAAQVAALELALAAHGHDIGVEDASGATSAGAWWAVATRQTRRSAIGKVKLGRGLQTRWHRVDAALRGAQLVPEQAQTIVRALEDLPTDLDQELIDQAEQLLVEYAQVHDAAALAVLGAHVLTVIAPEIGEERDRKRSGEGRAGRRDQAAVLHGPRRPRGRARPFTLPELQGAMLQKALQALAAPKHRLKGKVRGEERVRRVRQADPAEAGRGVRGADRDPRPRHVAEGGAGQRDRGGQDPALRPAGRHRVRDVGRRDDRLRG